MIDGTKKDINKQIIRCSERAKKRAPYSRPRLQNYGDIRGMTMGPSPGVGESGVAGIKKVPTP